MNKIKLLALLMITLPCMMQASDNGDDNESDTKLINTESMKEIPYVSIFDNKFLLDLQYDDNNEFCSSSSSKPNYTEVIMAVVFRQYKVGILETIIGKQQEASRNDLLHSDTILLEYLKMMQEVELNEEKLKKYRNNEHSAQQALKLPNNKIKRSSSF